MSDQKGHLTFQHGQEFLAAISERWNYQILREVFFGVGRFGELKRALGISANILTARLNNLTELGLLTKHAYRPDKPWYEYRLTDSARELVVPAIAAITRWAEEHASDGCAPPAAAHGVRQPDRALSRVQQLPPAGRGLDPAPSARRAGRHRHGERQLTGTEQGDPSHGSTSSKQELVAIRY